MNLIQVKTVFNYLILITVVLNMSFEGPVLLTTGASVKKFNVGGIFPLSSVPAIGRDHAVAAILGLEKFAGVLPEACGVELVWEPRTSRFLDDKSVPLSGLQHVTELSTTLGSLFVMGPWNTAVADKSGTLMTALGAPLLGGGSSPILGERKDFTGYFLASGNDRDAFVGPAYMAKKFGWRLLSVIATDDPFAHTNANMFRAEASKLGITVHSAYTLSFNIERLGKVGEVVSTLKELQAGPSRVYMVFMVEQDARVVLQEASKLGMLGTKKYIFLTSNGWSTSFTEDSGTEWPFGPDGFDEREKLIGVFGFVKNLNVNGPYYEEYINAYRSIKRNITDTFVDGFSIVNETDAEIAVSLPEASSTYPYDVANFMTYVVNATVHRLNALGIDIDCLKANRVSSDPSCQISIEERDAIMKFAEDEKLTGLLEYMKILPENSNDTFGLHSRSARAVMFHEIYKADLGEGLTTQSLKMRPDGDFVSEFRVVNYQVGAGKRAAGGVKGSVSFTWKTVGSFKGTTITFDNQTQLHFSGSTIDEPNLEVTDDNAFVPQTDSNGLSLTFILSVAVGGGVLLLILTVLIWRLRMQRRNSRIQLMVWLINRDDIEWDTEAHAEINFRVSLAVGLQQTQVSSDVSSGNACVQYSGLLGADKKRESGSFEALCIGRYKGNTVSCRKFKSTKGLLSRKSFLKDPVLLRDMYELKELNHSNINQFYGIALDEDAIFSESSEHLIDFFAVNAHYEKGSLEDILLNDALQLDSLFVFAIANDIANGLRYLHRSNFIAHGRLKPSNCVVDSRWTCKLTGFGFDHILLRTDINSEERSAIPKTLLRDLKVTAENGNEELQELIDEFWGRHAELLWVAPESLLSAEKFYLEWEEFADNSTKVSKKSTLEERKCSRDSGDVALNDDERPSTRKISERSIASYGSVVSLTLSSKVASLNSTTTPRFSILGKIGEIKRHSENAREKKRSSGMAIVNGKWPATAPGDIYGLGIILWQLITRKHPYSYLSSKRSLKEFCVDDGSTIPCKFIVAEVECGARYFHFEDDESVAADFSQTLDKLRIFVRSCVNRDPYGRPSAKVACQELFQLNPGKGTSLTDSMARLLEKYAHSLEATVEERTQELKKQTERIQILLYEMLPKGVADDLIGGKEVQPEAFESVTIFFSDIVGFTRIAGSSSPIQVIGLLNALYTCFDEVLLAFDVYKVETIGDAYMVASGLPERNGNMHAAEICMMALHLQSQMVTFRMPHKPEEIVQLRVGIHTGPVVAGVVGVKMPRYCLFGDTVNTASRMESGGLALRIHLSQSTAHLLKAYFPHFEITCRGSIEVKGKGTMQTYWLESSSHFCGARLSKSQAAGMEEHEFK